ncbi:hypothetical protein F5884DRAFT_873456 [Xylogone sp. PMI_703]|nr:hypothetical protein F5884DRAFT_873456 [Xylogone sp. PMI_703]
MATETLHTAPQPDETYSAGIIDGGDYGALSGFTKKVEVEPADEPHSIPLSHQKRFIIVGAGISGIQQATILLRDGHLKHEDIQIFDALDGYGGVWNKNKYPGCACDVPAMIYTTSYYVCKKYTNFFATQPQIESYYTDFAHKYGLDRCTRFRSFVRSCTWDDELFKWVVQVQNGITGETEHWLADFISQCVGTLDRPKFGTTPGRENFQGVSWHTAHWRHDYDLTGKKVAVIGCGPSAAQIIPEIIDKVGHLHVYMRNPPVCVARNDFRYSWLFRFACSWIPMFAYLVRQRMNWRMRLNMLSATNMTKQNDTMTKMAEDWLEHEVKDPELRELLKPHSKYYCKRPLRLDNFYSSLVKPNCTVLRDQLLQYTKSGVLSRDKKTDTVVERPFDVIIFGTGFNVAQHLEHIKITGINGIDLQKQWKTHPEALYGLATSNFPNMFMCFGPNTATVWSSQQDNWKLQAHFAAKAVRAIDKQARSHPGIRYAMYPNREAERIYNEELQVKQQKFVWADPSCTSYYKNDAGWITYTMPWSYPRFWLMLRKIKWEEWVLISAKISKDAFIN